MQTMIENYINGNLATAKAQAKRFGWDKIFKALRDDYGWTESRARATADFLKGHGSFQAACDADYQNRGLSASGAHLLNEIDTRRNR